MVSTSTERRESLFNKIKSKDITIDEALTFDSVQWYEAGLSTKKLKKDSLDGQKYLLKQIPTHKKEVLNYHITKNKISDKDYIDFLDKKVDKLRQKTEYSDQLDKIKKYEPDYQIQYPDKDGEYGIVLVKDFTEKQDYWIKYKDKKELKRRLDKLDKDSIPNHNYWIIFKGFGVYREFVDTEFDDMLAEV